MNKACYRKLKRYKYQLMEPYNLKIGIKGYTVVTPYLKLDADGELEISKGMLGTALVAQQLLYL